MDNIIFEDLEEWVRDITIGLMDGLTVPISVASGLVATGQSRETIIFAIIAEASAGSISMGLSDYLSLESMKSRTDIAWKSGLRVTIGYLIGASIPLCSYLFTSDVKNGFTLSIVFNILALIIFGYVRSELLKIDLTDSIRKVCFVGIIAIVLTYFISKQTDTIKKSYEK